MFQCKSSTKMPIEVWSDEWLNKTLKSFNVPGEMEWDICDNCRVHTHIHVAQWTLINNQTVLLCRQCQVKKVIDTP